MRTTTALLLLLNLAVGGVGAQAPTITSLLSKDVAGSPGKEVAMISVEYPPGGFDTVHRHNAQAFVYVLEGSVVMQVQGKAPITLGAGQTFRRNLRTFTSWRATPAAPSVPGFSCSSSRTRAPHSFFRRSSDASGEAAAREGIMNATVASQTRREGSLRGASINRLACLVRHWMWADEAMARFEGELAGRWQSDTDLPADHLFGAYYHWCALLCGVTEAALDHDLLAGAETDALRCDLEACLPTLRACRELLVVIPDAREAHPRIVDLLRNDEPLRRLRRLHSAFGEALREEQVRREHDLLDVQER